MTHWFKWPLLLRLCRAGVLLVILVLVHEQARWLEAQRGRPLSLRQARKFFPTADRVQLRDAERGLYYVTDSRGNTLGCLLTTSPQTDHIIGYSGPNNLLIALDNRGVIAGLELLRSGDTEEHVAKVKSDPRFLRTFIGWKPSEASPPVIEGVSGATLTCLAIAESIEQRLAGAAPSLRFPDPVTLAEVQTLFTSAVRLEPNQARWRVLDASDRLLGFAARTSPQADNVSGYRGPTECLVALAADGRTVIGVHVRKSYDTDTYVDQIRRDSHYLKLFVGRTIEELAALDYAKENIEGVSGATQTSWAVAEGMKRRFAAELKAQAQSPPWRPKPRDWALGSVVAGAFVLSFTSLRGHRWVRLAWQLLLVGYVGLVNHDLLSLALFGGWAAHGFALQAAPGLVLLAAAALLVPWTTRRQLYCHQICPHGAAQQLLGKLGSSLVLASRGMTPLPLAAAQVKTGDRSPSPRPSPPGRGSGAAPHCGVRPSRLQSLLRWPWLTGASESRACPHRQARAIVSSSPGGEGRGEGERASVFQHIQPLRQSSRSSQTSQTRILHRRWMPPARVTHLLELVPAVLLGFGLLALLLGWQVNLANLEPFDAWVWRAAGVATLVIAAVGLAASLFIPQAYCRFGCPTGALLNFVRSTGSADHWGRRDWTGLAFLAAALIATIGMRAWPRHEPAPEPLAWHGRTMGTTWSVKIHDEIADPATIEKAIAAEFESAEFMTSHWRTNTDLSQFNRAATTDAMPVPWPVLTLSRWSAEISRATEGAYDITVGSLVRLWGFGPGPRRTEPPTDEEIAALVPAVGWQKLEILDGMLRKQHPALEVDFSSIAVGWAIDQAAQLLERRGYTNYLVEAGGELRARGRWTIAIEHPIRACTLSDEAIGTSGTYRRKFESGGRQYSHLIDPRTGRPVTHGTVSVSVRHADCAHADAWAAALNVLGVETGLPLADRLNLAAQFVVERSGGNLEVVPSAAWRAREALPGTSSAGTFHTTAHLFMNTVALARCRMARGRGELFQQFVRGEEKPLKRLRP